MTSKADIAFIAARLRKAVDQLEKRGATAWDTTAAWKRGASTANYDPEHGGNRWEQDDDGTVWPVPSDTTGDAALHPERDIHAHDHYRHHLEQALHIADKLIEDITTGTPHHQDHIADIDKLATQVGAEGWCSSCYRIGKWVPQAMHPNGTVKYQGSCRWCHEFEKEYGRKPPRQLLERRHAGRSITTDEIHRVLGLKAKAS